MSEGEYISGISVCMFLAYECSKSKHTLPSLKKVLKTRK